MKKLLSIVSLGAVFAAAGAEFYLKSGATDWSAAASYCTDSARTVDATSTPGSADTIFVPAGTFSISSGTASFTVFANAHRIAPEATNSVIELDVADGDAEHPHAVSAMIYHGLAKDADRGVGVVVKKGAGFLHLTAKYGAVNANSAHVEYGVNFDVRAGTLRFPVDQENNTLCGFLKVADGAAVWFAQSDNYGTQMQFDYIEAEEGSLLTNATTRSSHVIGVRSCGGVYDRLSYIKGAVGGGVRFWSTGSIRFETTLNACRGAPTAVENYGELYSETGRQRGVFLVKKFGHPNEASSLGLSAETILAFGTSGGGFRYIGAGDETTSRNFYFYSAPFYSGGKGNAYPAFLDAGVIGGVTFTGTFIPGSDANTQPGVRRLFLVGDNANECVLAGPFSRLVKDNVTYPVYITKKGTGTWRFANHDERYHVGVTAVADGTLKFDSIQEQGSMCSLGLSTVLTPDDSAAITNNEYVTYAFLLGDAEGNGNPVFEYAGAAAAKCSTRPLALAGAGGTLKASAGKLDFGGVSARDENSSPTLTLDGTGTNVVRDISDGAAGAAVNVAKKGSGTWNLGGDLTFSGKVDVREGTLRVDVPHPIAWPERNYTWFRLSIAQIGTNGNTKTDLKLRQICLFDKDGVRQNSGLKMPIMPTALNFTVTSEDLAPGQVWLDDCVAGYTINSSYLEFLENCFREADGYNGTEGRFAMKLLKGSSYVRPTPSDGSTWIPIVMRLPEGANPIAYFDIQLYDLVLDYCTTRFKMEASTDGKGWDTVWSNIDGPELTPELNNNYNCWASDGVPASNNSHARAPGKGFTLSAQSGKAYDHFNWYRLSIARIGNAASSNAKLSIRQIGLYNSAGMRLNEGLTLAETPGGANELRVIQGAVPAEGQVGYDVSAAGLKVRNRSGTGHEIQDCFDGVYNGSDGGMCDITLYTSAGAEYAPVPTDRHSWIPIVMHLPAGTDPVSHFDIQNYGNSDALMPSRVMLEGSTDGENWYVMFDNATQGEPFTPTITSYNQWVSDGVSASSSSHARPLGKGIVVTGSHPTDPEPKDQFAHVASVSVAAGATLEATASLPLAGLSVDTTGAGTLKGFAFAANGTLDISGAGSLSPLPGTYVNCTGLDNLSGWSLKREGKSVPRGRIAVRNGEIYVLVPGLTVSFR